MMSACSRSSSIRSSRAPMAARSLSSRPVEHAFGRGSPFSLGMEEELILVDASTHALSHNASALLPRVQAPSGEVKFDVYEALLETATPIVRTAAEGGAQLALLRQAIRDAGGTPIGC